MLIAASDPCHVPIEKPAPRQACPCSCAGSDQACYLRSREGLAKNCGVSPNANNMPNIWLAYAAAMHQASEQRAISCRVSYWRPSSRSTRRLGPNLCAFTYQLIGRSRGLEATYFCSMARSMHGPVPYYADEQLPELRSDLVPSIIHPSNARMSGPVNPAILLRCSSLRYTCQGNEEHRSHIRCPMAIEASE